MARRAHATPRKNLDLEGLIERLVARGGFASQTELAAHFKVRQQTLNYWIHARGFTASLRNFLVRYAAAFGLDESALALHLEIRERDTPATADRRAPYGTTPGLERALAIVRRAHAVDAPHGRLWTSLEQYLRMLERELPAERTRRARGGE